MRFTGFDSTCLKCQTPRPRFAASCPACGATSSFWRIYGFLIATWLFLALCFALHEEEKIHRLADRVVELRAGRVEPLAGPDADRAWPRIARAA